MPTDRSKPPDRITIVCPQATIPRIAVCRLTLRRLVSLRKFGFMTAKTAVMSRITAMRPMLDRFARRSRASIRCRQAEPAVAGASPSALAELMRQRLERRPPALRLPDGGDVDLVGVVLRDDVVRREQLLRDRPLFECGEGDTNAPSSHEDGRLRHRCRDP